MASKPGLPIGTPLGFAGPHRAETPNRGVTVTTPDAPAALRALPPRFARIVTEQPDTDLHVRQALFDLMTMDGTGTAIDRRR